MLFTQSLNTGTLPEDWLTANTTPVYKKGCGSIPSNYRPISLTSVCSKVMEHIVFHSIMQHVQHDGTLSEFQHGFRSGYSCQTQLIHFIKHIQHAMDQQKPVDLILLDFSKAFDTVPHQRLLTKLAHYGIQGDAHRWIRSWLTLCTQYVVVDGEASDFVRVTSGVPQGTVLGPLMLLSYINYISEAFRMCGPTMYLISLF